MPPKKKKKKKSKDKPKEEVPVLDVPDDAACPSSSTAEPEVVAVKPKEDPAPPRIPEEETEVPKKKKKKKKKDKKEAGLEKFREQEREAKAKEMAKVAHWKLQHDQDFWAIQNYRKKIPEELLNTINGADHSDFLLEKLDMEKNYMSQKEGYKRNLMTIKRLLSRIAKYADDPVKHLREAQGFIKSTFPMVQGMLAKDKCSPKYVVWVLMDCYGHEINCEHPEYGKEQNIGLHDVISPAAMARVMATEIHIVDDIPTTVKVDLAYCLFCSYTASHHRALNNHVRMHL